MLENFEKIMSDTSISIDEKKKMLLLLEADKILVIDIILLCSWKTITAVGYDSNAKMIDMDAVSSDNVLDILTSMLENVMPIPIIINSIDIVSQLLEKLLKYEEYEYCARLKTLLDLLTEFKNLTEEFYNKIKTK